MQSLTTLCPFSAYCYAAAIEVLVMQFPYGVCDFQYIIENNLFYVDRTQLIPKVERAGLQIIFLRPRRFGKSLWLSTLENYYDIAKADKFEQLFGHLAIGKQPTKLHNKYVVMKWDFSNVEALGSVDDIRQRLHQHINKSITGVAQDYAAWFNVNVEIEPQNAIASFYSLINTVRHSSLKLYLLIDEYDNFTNELMMGGGEYTSLVHGEGAVRAIFKAVKAAAAGMGLERVFITGVSPIAMSDITSAYNVASNIYLLPDFNGLCGFTENEISAALELIAQEHSIAASEIKRALDMMRTFYNGYRFAEDANYHVYNPTMALYFLRHFFMYGKFPKNILDENLAMDSNKIHFIAALANGREVIGKALDDNQALVIPQLCERFGVQRIHNAQPDQTFVASLLYYLGALTMTTTPLNMLGETVLHIPNLVMKKLYVEEISAILLPDAHQRDDIHAAAKQLSLQGNISPLCQCLQGGVFKSFSNRDYRWSNELVIKTAFLAALFNDRLYIMDSEPELQRGYADLSMIVRPDMRHYGQLLDILLEFKFIKLTDT
ncbi:MAG: AAA family ATPase, partial [Mariprofundales bacterium]